MRKYKVALTGLAYVVALLCSSASGETHVIQISDFQFTPATTNILRGDTVIWSNSVSTPHTTTSGTSPTPNGLWNSGTIGLHGTFSHTFTNAGNFAYFCSIHTFMIGGISVLDGVVDVTITDAGLSRTNVTILKNDFVRWTNAGSVPHSIAPGAPGSGELPWPPPILAQGDVYSSQYNTYGAFDYHDSLNTTNPYGGSVRVIDQSNILFNAAGTATNGELVLQWTSVDTRKYDLITLDDLLIPTNSKIAVANIQPEGTGTNTFTDPPYLSSPRCSFNKQKFYRLGVVSNNMPTLSVQLVAIASNLTSPTALTHAGDGSGRLFITDQAGKIFVVDSNKVLRPAPFLDLSGKLAGLAPNNIGGITNLGLNPIYDERGLLGLAFHPGYATNGIFFVYYSSPKSGAGIDHENIVAKYHVSPTNANVASTNETVIFRTDEPEFNHNGGCLAFGPDGYLYIPLGDGGGAGDQHGTIGNGQNVSNVLGSVLRVDVDHGSPYSIPADNPFVGGPGLPEIWAYGFRNPWKISFDRGGSNQLIVADVGQDLWEEIDFVHKGGNYGWRIMEGNHAYDIALAGTLGIDIRTLQYPVHEYGHGPTGIAIIGGYVYRGTNYPALQGNYVFGDFSRSFGAPDGALYYLSETRPGIWERFEFTLNGTTNRLGRFVKGFGQDQNGELYLLSATSLGPSGVSGDVRQIMKMP
jgi:glucose/arabinose dehydrogenase/plastocyanin